MPKRQKDQLDLGSILQLLSLFQPSTGQQLGATQSEADRQAHTQNIQAELAQRSASDAGTLALHRMVAEQQGRHETAMEAIQKQIADIQGKSNDNSAMALAQKGNSEAASNALEYHKNETAAQLAREKDQQAAQDRAATVAEAHFQHTAAMAQLAATMGHGDLALMMMEKGDAAFPEWNQKKAASEAAINTSQEEEVRNALKLGGVSKADQVARQFKWEQKRRDAFIFGQQNTPTSSAVAPTGPAMSIADVIGQVAGKTASPLSLQWLLASPPKSAPAPYSVFQTTQD